MTSGGDSLSSAHQTNAQTVAPNSLLRFTEGNQGLVPQRRALTGHFFLPSSVCLLLRHRHLLAPKHSFEQVAMGDRFVSGGTISSNGEATKDADAVPQTQPAKTSEWEIVQRELEAERRRREEARVKLATGGEEKSLYDVLQANKGEDQRTLLLTGSLRRDFGHVG